ncbi:TetR/AcrR family transcriptional regulator [Streptomyces cavernicola]|uniref:Helix-turn-helix domain-containing protein n=1 Tax=Streptomyces cavernicola TaxID=3043613 RepID=A0ABT6S9Y9_9ACTN|nr:TetR/AcrR family transcriptional regulator [Streptomyces sp. B-S-A6]MDI3404991.1 helix-turn-helix domain-containing protein [Streptomyces sp. B-S-A6]
MDSLVDDEPLAHVVAVADELFFTYGVHAVTMQRIRSEAGVPLKKLYGMFPSKDALLAACLERRDVIARSALADRAEKSDDPVERVLSVFDFLDDWFRQPGFHGCVFAGAFGEAGAAAPVVVSAVQAHKQSLRELVTGLVARTEVRHPDAVGAQLAVLFDGAMALATFTGDTDAARHAREAAQTVLAAALRD